MAIFVDPSGHAEFGIGLCARCSRKFPLDELFSDPNSPGLKVCADDLDDYDPYRLPARRTEDIALRFTRPDVSLEVPSLIINPSVTLTLSNNTQDGWESGAFWVSFNTGCQWGDDDGADPPTDGGLHFTTVPIPPSSLLISATLNFNIVATVANPGTATLFVDKGAFPGGDPQPPVTFSNVPRSDWWPRRAVGQVANLSYSSTGLKSIGDLNLLAGLQELINLPGWATGNSINLGFHATGSWLFFEKTSMEELQPTLTISWKEP